MVTLPLDAFSMTAGTLMEFKYMIWSSIRDTRGQTTSVKPNTQTQSVHTHPIWRRKYKALSLRGCVCIRSVRTAAVLCYLWRRLQAAGSTDSFLFQSASPRTDPCLIVSHWRPSAAAVWTLIDGKCPSDAAPLLQTMQNLSVQGQHRSAQVNTESDGVSAQPCVFRTCAIIALRLLSSWLSSTWLQGRRGGWRLCETHSLVQRLQQTILTGRQLRLLLQQLCDLQIDRL